MKKLFKVALVAVGMLFAGNFANAQTKLAILTLTQLLMQMPKLKQFGPDQAYQKQFIDVLTT
jgi:outer membrane protein